MQTMEGQSGAPKIGSLTSVRFFAAFLVLIHHYALFPREIRGFWDIQQVGYAAVDFFFVLSGFIMATVYLAGVKPVHARSYYVARFARIYPLYILSIFLDLPSAWYTRVNAHGFFSAMERVLLLLVPNILMIQIWLPWPKIINIPSWTLSTEAVFYLLFPFLGVFLWRKSKSAPFITMIALFCFMLLFNFFLLREYPDNEIHGFQLPIHVSEFGIGIVLSRLYANFKLRSPGWVLSPGRAWAILFSSACVIAIVVGNRAILLEWFVKDSTALSPCFAAVIFVLAASRISLTRMLETKWMVLLGEASFALYLLHVPIASLAKMAGVELSRKEFPVYACFCVGASILSYLYIETPLRKRINAWLR